MSLSRRRQLKAKRRSTNIGGRSNGSTSWRPETIMAFDLSKTFSTFSKLQKQFAGLRQVTVSRSSSARSLYAVSGALFLAGAGIAYISSPKASVTTEDAYLKADNTTVAPRIRGLVAEILVHDNQSVRAGDPLVQIEPEEFDARVAAATADLLSAQAGVDAVKAALAGLDAEEQLAAANVRAAESSIQSADAQNSKASGDRKRYDRLVITGTASQRDADQYRAAAATAQSEADRTRAALDVSKSQVSVTQARRPLLRAQLAQAEAAAAKAKAALDLARQDRAHTLIRAPIDGVVGNRQAQAGDYVQPGTRLLTLVPVHAVYALAFFKETQTGRMTPGQEAIVEVDAFSELKLKGKVESLAPGSGSEFALLPFEPGTGNFTKIVQRIPVRIILEPGQPDLSNLRPGLSATVTVALKQK